MNVGVNRNILILTTVSGFLCKFEIENVKILQKLGYVVHYATNTEESHYHFDESELEELGVQMYHIDIARSPYMIRANEKARKQLIRIVEEYNIQAIHAHTPVGGVLARRVAKHLKKKELKIVYTAHGFHFYKGAPLINNTLYRYAEKYYAKYTDLLIVINEEDYQNAKKLRLRKGGVAYKIEGVGLDLEKFQPCMKTQRSEQRKKLGIGENDFFAVSVGELNENKNQGIVLEALAKKRQNAAFARKLKYGICGDGFLNEQIHTEIERLNLKDTVLMFGYRKNVSEILGCADLLIFPSKREGLGMAALEALAMEVPVLAADNRGTREYMQHKKNGYVCKSDDIDGFIRGIDYIMNLTVQEQREMKDYTRKSVKRFDKNKIKQKMREIYLELD